MSQALAAAEIKPESDALAKLDGIWPGSGGETPEVHAWQIDETDEKGERMKPGFSMASIIGMLFSFVVGAQIAISECMAANAYDSHHRQGLVYDSYSSNPVPVPLAELGLQTVDAFPLKVVGNNGQTLEGAIFDARGNLLFCNVSDRKVMRLTPDGQLATLFQIDDFSPGGLAFSGDGRLFVAAINQKNRRGAILALLPDNKNLETIIPPDAGYLPNDLVFDANGGFYFSDFKGSSTQPLGGVYYVAPDFRKISPVIPHLAQANGVALSPDGKTLWATEYARNLLHRANLVDPATVPLTGSNIPYRFIGPAPDSMRVDRDGNVYVAMVGQGRVMVFNPAGMPIAQVLLPGRDKGLNLRSTSLALHPAAREMRIVTGNTPETASGEAAVFSAPAFSGGLKPADGK